MHRPRHSKKEIEKVLQEAEDKGFTIRYPWGHWGGLICTGDCNIIAIWSTPKNTGNHAKQLRRAINRCPHRKD